MMIFELTYDCVYEKVAFETYDRSLYPVYCTPPMSVSIATSPSHPVQINR
jgi:hypothetical protein